MDVIEFSKELERMCETHMTNSIDGCTKCPGYELRVCSIRNLEQLLPIVEKWSAEHPFIRNVDHVAEGLEKLGYKVDKEYLIRTCPVPYSSQFMNIESAFDCSNKETKCKDCRKWWLEEYKGEENE